MAGHQPPSTSMKATFSFIGMTLTGLLRLAQH